MREFRVEDANRLCDLLRSRKVLSEARANDTIGALSGLYERVAELFDKQIPALMEDLASSQDAQDKSILEDIEFSCCRIHQHLYDGRLIPLERGFGPN
jgi:hypothetical protein